MRGLIVSEKSRYYPCMCNECGWIGSSGSCGTDNGYYDSDSEVYCPRCGSPDTDEYKSARYPIYHLLTDLISRYKAWRMAKREAKYYDSLGKE